MSQAIILPLVVLLFRVLQLNLSSFHYMYLQEFMIKVIFPLYMHTFSVLTCLASVSWGKKKKKIRRVNNIANHFYLKTQCKINIVV